MSRRTSPYTDFAGNAIREGDTIQHPSGESGRVVFMRGYSDPGDSWRVRYSPGAGGLSRLCLQIGSKGMAVVVKK